MTSSKESCKAAVLKYLTLQNRPYSASDIIQNLHKEFGKTAVQKAVDELTSELKVREKVYGKQKVYVIAQGDEIESDSQKSSLEDLEISIGEAMETLKTLESDLKTKEIFLKELSSEPTTESASETMRSLQDSIDALNEKINVLSESAVEVISSEDKNKLSKEFEKFMKEHKKRKKGCMDILSSILENYPKKTETLFDEIGIELDDHT